MGITQLGGTRQSSPVQDEMTYPLTEDEYLIIKENLSIDKFTNWESFLLTIAITSIISGAVIWVTGSFEKQVVIEGKDVFKVNILQVIMVIIYGALSFGAFLGFFISKSSKRKSEKPMHRLDSKIMSHINTVTNE